MIRKVVSVCTGVQFPERVVRRGVHRREVHSGALPSQETVHVHRHQGQGTFLHHGGVQKLLVRFCRGVDPLTLDHKLTQTVKKLSKEGPYC